MLIRNPHRLVSYIRRYDRQGLPAHIRFIASESNGKPEDTVVASSSSNPSKTSGTRDQKRAIAGRPAPFDIVTDPFDAFDHLRDMQSQMFNQFLRASPFGAFSSFFKDPFQVEPRSTRELGRGFRHDWPFDSLARVGPRIAVDVEEHDKEFVIKAEVPGINKDGVKVQIQDDVVYITVETNENEDKTEKDDKGNITYHRMERRSGSASRAIRMPDTANLEQVSAKMDNGVLLLTIPKNPEDRTERREVNID